jgi:hypothetical protein
LRFVQRLRQHSAVYLALEYSVDGNASLQVHEQTSVELKEDDFLLVRTNVVGRSRGFSLLGLITIYPATLTKAMNRMYASAEMQPGHPQTVAHLVIEQTTTYWILFGVPEINARADIVEFKPVFKNPAAPDLSPTGRRDDRP